MIRILEGRAGRIAPLMFREIKEAREKGQRIYLLVPEQFTLLMERELMRELALPGLVNLDVVSPSRLRRSVFDRGGQPPQSILDARGRRMALSRALMANRTQLHYYEAVADTPGLPDKLAVLLSDMKKAQLTPQTLAEHVAALPAGAARAKEEDLTLIWDAYEKLLSGRFVDGDSAEEEMIRRLPQSGVMRGAAVWVYGFDVLALPFCRLLTVVAGETSDLTVTMTMDGEQAPDGRIFRAQQNSVRQLGKLLSQAGYAWQHVRASDSPMQTAPALQWLEAQLFAAPQQALRTQTDAVELLAAPNPFAETMETAAWLWREHERGVAWSEMAVAMADGATYGPMLRMTLKASGIPFYLSEKLPAARHGLIRMLLAALRCCGEGWKQEDVLALMKSGFSPLAAEETFALENYALENGIRGKRWETPFTRGAQAETMEPLRQHLMEPLLHLRREMRQAKDAQASMTAVFGLLQEVNAYGRLLRREEELLARGMEAEAAQNRQIWRLILETLDQQRELLDGSRAPMDQVAAWLAAGFENAEISALPPTPDTVMVGEVGHMALISVRSLAVVGMQDQGGGGQASLLSDRERGALSAWLQQDVGLNSEVQQALRQSDYYRTLALAQERLLLSHAQSTQDGEALRPGSVWMDVRTALPEVAERGGVQPMEEQPLAPRTALNGLSLHLRAMAEGRETQLPPAWADAFAWLWQHEPYHETLDLALQHVDARVSAPPLDPDKAWRLFGRDTVSISRLQEFATCPYQHFVRYGLSPVERRDFTFEADDRGTFFHAALSEFTTLAMQLPAWPERMEEQDVDAVMDTVIAPLMNAWQDGPLAEDARNRALGRRYAETVKRAAWLFTRHMRNSRFVTQGAEVAFGEPEGLPPLVLELPDGSRIALRGRIDRIDRYEGDSGVYLRVVDAKSSANKLEPTRMWYGLQLQLLLYLKAATAATGTEPAGAFYFTVSDPMCDVETDVKALAEAAIAKKLRLKGVVLADTEILEAMDKDEPGFSVEKVFNADGSISQRATAVDMQEMQALLQHAQNVAAQLAGEMRRGRIAAHPAVIGDWSACTYCRFRDICGVDPKDADMQNQLPDMNKEEFRRRLANERKTDTGSKDAVLGGNFEK